MGFWWPRQGKPSSKRTCEEAFNDELDAIERKEKREKQIKTQSSDSQRMMAIRKRATLDSIKEPGQDWPDWFVKKHKDHLERARSYRDAEDREAATNDR